MFLKHPWKSNFQKIPSKILTSLADIKGDLITVAGTKTVSRSDVAAGIYSHIGLRLEGNAVATDGASLPPSDAGKWSARNLDGWDRRREDWPKVNKTWTFESPNFGDGARNGWTMRSWTREIYQHQIFEPQGMTIDATLLDDRGTDNILVKFALFPMLSRSMPEFELMLLWALNILQENTGIANVFPSEATNADYIATVNLDWQVFPPGTTEEVITRLTGAAGSTSNPDHERHVEERVRLFESFKPVAYLRGQGGFGSYFGAQFADDLVVFENLQYGNAVYLLYDDWAEASQRSRLDLLRDRDAHFDRVEHRDGWEGSLKALLHDELFKRGLRKRRSGYRSRRLG